MTRRESTKGGRSILFVINPNRPDARSVAEKLSALLEPAGFSFFAPSDSGISGAQDVALKDNATVEIAVVLGGDGTMLRGAELVRDSQIPLLGINLGHVGFLAEVDKPTIEEIAQAIIDKRFTTETRMLLSYSVERGEKIVATGWALNEVTIERNSSAMVQLFLQIDSRPLSRWGCDGVICATPTGSTAYAFSAGGPVVWPEVDALVLLPISAHALFSRPMVVSPDSKIVIDIESERALLLGDSLREFLLLEGDRVAITKDSKNVKLAHVHETLFSDRLVAKFKLPIEGWRGE